MLEGNLLFAQSGGPTAVINASAAGVILEARKHKDQIHHVYGAMNGIVGVFNEHFIDLDQESEEEILKLKHTPSSFLGSCRRKLVSPDKDPSDYEKLLEIFKKYNIRFFFYNGGNDSMDTCNKIAKFMAEKDYAFSCMGIPKTIDNDLACTDHSPGYPSAARYIATTMMEIAHDAVTYDIPQITVVEIMGRHAGWLTAASHLASVYDIGPDLIYVPERAFSQEAMIADVGRILKEKGKVMIALSEGIHNEEGVLMAEVFNKDIAKDAFGHAQLGGIGQILGQILEEKFKVKIRTIELSLMQRCAAHLASQLDIDECFKSGQMAVQKAVTGATALMPGFHRDPISRSYQTEIVMYPLDQVANAEDKLPDAYINEAGNGITDAFVDYLLPLIQGDLAFPYKDGLPDFAKLQMIQVPKL